MDKRNQLIWKESESKKKRNCFTVNTENSKYKFENNSHNYCDAILKVFKVVVYSIEVTPTYFQHK